MKNTTLKSLLLIGGLVCHTTMGSDIQKTQFQEHHMKAKAVVLKLFVDFLNKYSKNSSTRTDFATGGFLKILEKEISMGIDID